MQTVLEVTYNVLYPFLVDLDAGPARDDDLPVLEALDVSEVRLPVEARRAVRSRRRAVLGQHAVQLFLEH